MRAFVAAIMFVGLASFGTCRAAEFCASGSFAGTDYLLGGDLNFQADYNNRLASMSPERRRAAALQYENIFSNRGNISTGGVWTMPLAQAEYKKCAVGDIIFIPSTSKSVVGVLCDFTKAIATVGSNIMCTMAEERKAH